MREFGKWVHGYWENTLLANLLEGTFAVIMTVVLAVRHRRSSK